MFLTLETVCKLPPGNAWVAPSDASHTALAYVRSGSVRVNGLVAGEVKEGSTCTFGTNSQKLLMCC